MEYQFSQSLLSQGGGEGALEKGILGHSCYQGGDGEGGGPALTGKGEQGNTEEKGPENK